MVNTTLDDCEMDGGFRGRPERSCDASASASVRGRESPGLSFSGDSLLGRRARMTISRAAARIHHRHRPPSTWTFLLERSDLAGLSPHSIPGSPPSGCFQKGRDELCVRRSDDQSSVCRTVPGFSGTEYRHADRNVSTSAETAAGELRAAPSLFGSMPPMPFSGSSPNYVFLGEQHRLGDHHASRGVESSQSLIPNSPPLNAHTGGGQDRPRDQRLSPSSCEIFRSRNWQQTCHSF